ncbi:complement C1r subcomponent isoform X2 [Dendropsophus ebraccatus]|uniref:complement C1r subcomponent isoform X2 n=1 Tax=Dendropsophus ebraccatus TaxID=150705 RepID=UPI003831F7C7
MLLCLLLFFGIPACSTSSPPQYGLISSPDYPRTYPNLQHRTWNISVHTGFHIALNFLVFDLEPSDGCNYDYVKVFDDNRELGRFCGPKKSRSHPGHRLFVSHGNQMKIEFQSDFSNEENGSAVFYKGFQAFYRAVDDDECESPNDNSLTWTQPCQHICHNYIGGYTCSCLPGYALQSDKRSCKVQCSNLLFMEESGFISSPEYPQPYPPDLNCTYRIRLERGMHISLRFMEIFDIDDHPQVTCPYDTLKIFEADNLVSSLCGRRTPEVIKTRSNEVDIVFQTDDSGDSRGWKIFYTSQPVQCPKPITLDQFSIVSPMQEVYTMGEYFVLSCSTGYRLMENGQELSVFTAVCQRDGTWHRSVPRCEIVSCKEPEILRNGGHVFLTEPNRVTYLSRITYSCNAPYYKMATTAGSASFTCTEDRVWKDDNGEQQIPICLPVCGKPQNPVTGVSRALYSKEAENGNFPWQALLVPGMGRAGGVLIDEKWILTAAHVLKPAGSTSNLNVNNLHVFLGDVMVDNLVKTGLAKVKAYHIHPEYSTDNHDHDIALIQLEKPVTMNSHVSPICLPESSEASLYVPGMMGYVSGFGVRENNINTNILRYVELPMGIRDDCQLYLRTEKESNMQIKNQKFTENMFCAGDFALPQDACRGDSGGAYAVRQISSKTWFAMGLVSWGVDCGRGYGFYTKVGNYIDWIRGHMSRG